MPLAVGLADAGPSREPTTVEWEAGMRLARGRFALPGLRPGLVK